MKDYILFLIVIGISVIGAISRNKKKRTQEGVSTPQGERKSRDLFSFLEQLADNDDSAQKIPTQQMYSNDVDESQQPESDVAPEPIPNKYAKRTGYITAYEKQRLMNEEAKSMIPDNVSTKHKKGMLQTNKQKIVKNEIRSTFKLKDAVIYSAILNRKYS